MAIQPKNTDEIKVNTISEKTAASGVTIDGVLIKDSQVSTDQINEDTAAAGVTVDGVLLKDSQVSTDQINEKTPAAGVTIDGVLLKDSQVTTDVINEKTGAAGVTIDGVLLKDSEINLSTYGSLTFDTSWSLNPAITGTGTATFSSDLKWAFKVDSFVFFTVVLSVAGTGSGTATYIEVDLPYSSASSSHQPFYCFFVFGSSESSVNTLAKTCRVESGTKFRIYNVPITSGQTDKIRVFGAYIVS